MAATVVAGVVGIAGGAELSPVAGAFSRIYAGTLSGFLNPSDMKFQIGLAMGDAGGFSASDRWGPNSDPAWQRNDPYLNIDKLISHLWIYCGNGTATNVDKDRGLENVAGGLLEGIVLPSNKQFTDAYTAAGGTNAHVDLPNKGLHNWTYWGQQLRNMKSDLTSYLTNY